MRQQLCLSGALVADATGKVVRAYATFAARKSAASMLRQQGCTGFTFFKTRDKENPFGLTYNKRRPE